MIIKNTILEDICAVIGLNATVHLVVWFGDTNNLYIPNRVNANHFLSRLIGFENARRLCAEWPAQIVQIPSFRGFEDLQKRKQIVRMYEMGFGYREIATNFKMTMRRVEQICREFEGAGLSDGARHQAPKVRDDLDQLLLPGLDELPGIKNASRAGAGWPEEMPYKIPG